MAKGVFIQNPASIYDDAEGAHYHYPSLYHSRVRETVGDWVILYESGNKAREYYAVAEVARTRPDPVKTAHFYADYVPGSYLDFARRVPLRRADGHYHSRLIEKAKGRPNGVAQAAVQPLNEDDFWRILQIGTQADDALFMPRRDEDTPQDLHEGQQGFDAPFARRRVNVFLSKAVRSRTFRARVLSA